jgi:hypothetical protein
MWINGKRVGSLDASDIVALINSRVPESRRLEYKSELPGGRDADRRDFVADVSAFANADGGAIIFGIATAREGNADTGIAEQAVGLSVNLDEAKRRLISLLVAGVDPPLVTHVEFQEVVGGVLQNPVLVLGIAQSLERPHRVEMDGSHRIWRRGDGMKYEPSVSELRRMFSERTSWITEAMRYRDARIEWLRASSVVDLEGSVLVHLLPLGRLDDFHDLRNAQRIVNSGDLPLLSTGHGVDFRYNADGFQLIVTGYQSSEILEYLQFLRSGGSEAYSRSFLGDETNGKRPLWARELHAALLRHVVGVRAKLAHYLRVEPPLVLLLSLIGVRNAYVATPQLMNRRTIDRDRIDLPPAILTSDSEADTICKDLMHVVYQAAGLAGAPS